MKPRIAITLGDPAGIGPEIITAALGDARVLRACTPVIFGKHQRVRMGHASRAGGRLAIEALEQSLRAIQDKSVQALVTAPVSKESFQFADYGFPGHTEWLAKEAGAREVAMMMVAGPLRTILMTRHLPLNKVSAALTPLLIRQAAELGYAFARNQLGIVRPRLVACGLNPHAGDGGILGTEEKRVYAPALRTLKKKGIRIAGPVASDTVFPDMLKGRYDVALAAYHDQGMIPLKLYARERMVNVTLGLPFIRTSPAHGTAYDIAGKGKASPAPMIEAILLAAKYTSS